MSARLHPADLRALVEAILAAPLMPGSPHKPDDVAEGIIRVANETHADPERVMLTWTDGGESFTAIVPATPYTRKLADWLGRQHEPEPGDPLPTVSVCPACHAEARDGEKMSHSLLCPLKPQPTGATCTAGSGPAFMPGDKVELVPNPAAGLTFLAPDFAAEAMGFRDRIVQRTVGDVCKKEEAAMIQAIKDQGAWEQLEADRALLRRTLLPPYRDGSGDWTCLGCHHPGRNTHYAGCDVAAFMEPQP